MIRIIAIVVASIALTASAPGYAEDAPSMKVRYADLNLADPAGSATFKVRVRLAADALCGKSGERDLHMAGLIAGCRAKVFASAEPQVAELTRSAQLASSSVATHLVSR